MTENFFGTDGIRGKVGSYPITPDFMLRLGWAIGHVFGKTSSGMVLIGKDTRVSGYMFESALQAGLVSSGIDVALLGPMPTPGIAYLTRTLNASGGIVISASHNPYYDNGVKFFSEFGTKLDAGLEAAISKSLEINMEIVASDKIGKVTRVNDASGRYVEFCKSCFPSELNLRGLKIALDCAHGAAYQVAPKVFAELGAEVTSIGVEPDGYNINSSVGSTRPEALSALVIESKSDLGIALDGDGDRLIMIDRNGEVVDGDEILYVIALSKLKKGTLEGGVVGTQMTNFGIEEAFKRLDVPFFRAPVGDRYVLEELMDHKWKLGGEASGHILCLDLVSTGDAIVSSLQVLAGCLSLDKSLDQIIKGLNKFPQHIINVPYDGGFKVDPMETFSGAIREVESKIGEKGRVILRPSGTEPVIRVMVEGQDQSQVIDLAEQLAKFVENECNKTV